nr:EVE domain-containing protein [Elizabethkingia bruuniana]
MRGINGNFIQVCHGKKAPLKRMSKGDMILIYSSKITLDGNEKCQKFTAIGKVADDEIYSFQMSENFVPFRRKIKFYACEEYSILPLIAELDFIENKKCGAILFVTDFLKSIKRL